MSGRLLPPQFVVTTVLWFACLGVSFAWGADRVEVVRGDGSGRTFVVEGTIVDFTGEQLVLQPNSGNERTIPTKRVLRLDSEWHPRHLAGDEAFAAGRWRQGAEEYGEANSAETRTWARRLILTRLMQCHANIDNAAAAGDLFLLLVRSDPHTPAFEFMPLAWTPATTIDRHKARAWLNETNQPAARLLGASHLLATNDRVTAVQALSDLRTDATEPLIAAFAEVQTWRAEISSTTFDEVARWRRQVEGYPAAVQAGAWFTLATAYEHLQLPEEAILAYLRIPVLYADHHQLAARALSTAGRLSARIGQVEEARTLLAEVVSHYGDTAERAVAESELRKLDR